MEIRRKALKTSIISSIRVYYSSYSSPIISIKRSTSSSTLSSLPILLSSSSTKLYTGTGRPSYRRDDKYYYINYSSSPSPFSNYRAVNTKEEIKFAPLIEPTIIYSDNHLLVVNKPPGWHSVPNPIYKNNNHNNNHKNSGTIIENNNNSNTKCLLTKLKQMKLGGGSQNDYLIPLHRIDQPCTGLLLYGKTNKCAKRITKLWKLNNNDNNNTNKTDNQVIKEYICVVSSNSIQRLINASSSISSPSSIVSKQNNENDDDDVNDDDVNIDNDDDDDDGWYVLNGNQMLTTRKENKSVIIQPIFDEVNDDDDEYNDGTRSNDNTNNVRNNDKNSNNNDNNDNRQPNTRRLSLEWKPLSMKNTMTTTTTTKTKTTTISGNGKRYFTLILVRTLQGAKHQVRAMLAQVGHCPIIGDVRYNNQVPKQQQQRLPLQKIRSSGSSSNSSSNNNNENGYIYDILPDQSVALHAYRISFNRNKLQLGNLNQFVFKVPIPTTWKDFFGIEEDDIVF